MINSFMLDGYCSADYGIIMTEPPSEVIAEREIDKISVAGRSGDLVIDSGRYKNVSISYKCAILPDYGQTLRDATTAAVSLLMQTAAYMRLENTYHPEFFRMARITSEISFESIAEQAGLFTIGFDCKPQRFLKSGDSPQFISRPTTLYNDGMPAQPIIKVHGTGDGTVTVGDITVQLFGLEDTITLDCEMQNAYRETGGVLENMNLHIYAPEFPNLPPGNCAVSWSGGVERLEIIPRWWTV